MFGENLTSLYRLLLLSLVGTLSICQGQEANANADSDVKCMRPEDARLLRPSFGVPYEWMNNKWHHGPYVSLGNDEEYSSEATDQRGKSIEFTTREAERIWLLEDTMNSPGTYFIINVNMTNLICGHDFNGYRLSWFHNEESTRLSDWCRWYIHVDPENPANFKFKNVGMTKGFSEISYVYFDKTGVYVDYDERLRNYPDHTFLEAQIWWTFVKFDSQQRDYDSIENQCEIGENGLPTFLDNLEEGASDVTVRGATGGRRRRPKMLKSKDKFATCEKHWYLFNGKCYRIFKDFRVTQPQAERVCGFFENAAMFVPRNKKERSFVMRLIRIYDNRPGYYWLGIEADSSGTFRDRNNKEVSMRSWARARASFAKDACAIWKRRTFRANCAATHKVICEKKAAQRISGSCGKIQFSEIDVSMKFEAQQEKETKDRIVNGEEAVPGQYPWQVGIRFKKPIRQKKELVSHNCGASLIDSCWVVTAAHCVAGTPKDMWYVVLGDSNNEVDDGTEQTFDIDKMIVHEDYKSYPAPIRDIALLRLKPKNGKCARFNKFVQPICLPDDDEVTEAGAKCQVSGWGQTNTTLGQSSAAANLMWTTLPLLTDKYCESRYNDRSREYFNDQFMICAGFKKGGTDACTGDSGGPYACRNKEGRYVLTGIVSYGIGCARRKYPGVYTRVSEFVPWIATKIQANGGGDITSN